MQQIYKQQTASIAASYLMRTNWKTQKHWTQWQKIRGKSSKDLKISIWVAMFGLPTCQDWWSLKLIEIKKNKKQLYKYFQIITIV